MKPRIGLVLSGGGARGAYEVGVLMGVAEALAAKGTAEPLFRVMAGTSVGAINAAWLAAHAQHGDHAIGGLADLWRDLALREHLRVDLPGLLGWRGFARKVGLVRGPADRLGRSLLNPAALERLVHDAIPWGALHDNLAQGRAHALIIAALHVGTGLTTIFGEAYPGCRLQPMRHPRRLVRRDTIGPEHLLASAAIPALFPARRVGNAYFVDGGLRFNTPISAVLRTGAEKLVVISLRHEPPRTPDLDDTALEEQYPDPLFLAGKLLNALLLDPVDYDLQVLDRLNQITSVLDRLMTDEERERFDEVISQTRGAGYRTLTHLTFVPSESIARLAGEHVHRHLAGGTLGPVYEWLMGVAGAAGAPWESDLASYLLFDGAWAETLMQLGRRDALARRDELRDFFAR